MSVADRLWPGAAAGMMAAASAAWAGPPYDTDDPVPTDAGHWEIYAFAGGDGHGRNFDGSTGVDLNYGPIKNVQLTATLPLDLMRRKRLTLRGGDVELGAKIRLIDKNGFSLAVFPRAIMPTGGGRTGALFPMWAQQDWGKTSLFGGGGYAMSPDAAGRDHWFGAVALTHEMSERLSLGIEATRLGRDARDARATSTLGIGGICKLSEHLALLASGGPSFEDGSHTIRYHAYFALGATF
ncbi:MAG TPA: hypothetical protein VL405_04515 [Sphingomonas sp.]|jgi:hypothetical protein|nr:hypothetical protein [Sphingomonas sp.]